MKRKLATIRPQPNSDAIRSARRICSLIERGDVTSIGWVYVSRGGAVTTGWDAGPHDAHRMCSGATSLSFRLAKMIDESEG